MAWSNGVYTRGYASWTADANAGLPISASKFDTEDNDFAAGLNNCITVDGLNKPAATIAPATTASYDLGSGSLEWRNLYISGTVNCNALNATTITGNITYTGVSYPQTAPEAAGSVTPANPQYLPLDPRRYTTIAQWSAVYNATSAQTDTYWPMYRGDHALHPSFTNCLIGYEGYNDSLLTGTVGYRCTALGALTLQQNFNSTLAGGSNTAIGYASLQSNIEGSGNTGCGAFTLSAISGTPGTDSNHHNNAFGYRTWSALTNGIQNNGFGFEVGNSLLTGSNNHGFGESALFTIVNGNGNIAFGYQSLFSKLGGDFTHAFGYQTLFNETAAVITGITKAASAVITISTVSGSNPFTIGGSIVVEGVSGMTQINGQTGLVSATGGSSGAWTVTINVNSSAFSTYTSSGYLAPLGNTAIGYQAGIDIIYAGGNTIVGFQAANQGTCDINNTVIGYQAGQALASGGYNVAIGFQALLRSSAGTNNVVVGQQAGNFIGQSAANSTDHTVMGANAGQGITSALRNVCIGSSSGVNLNGNNNTSVGYNSGSQGSTQTYANCGSFGSNAVPTAANQITLGDSGIATLRCQQTTITALSDIRFKTDIRPLEISAEAFADLNPVVFRWIEGAGPEGEVMGFIAQDLDRWQTKWGLEWMGLVSKANPDRWEASPMKLFFPLLKQVQSMESRLQRLEELLVP